MSELLAFIAVRSSGRPGNITAARGGVRLVASLALGIVAIALSPASAFGHASFLASQPDAGARLKRSPSEVVLRFTEPLNRKLSRAALVNLTTGKRVPATAVQGARREVALRPHTALGRAPYRVEWHTVSTLDGHPLEGSFSFGVRTAAVGGEHQTEQSPLARDGWIRILARAVFYAALFFFAGGLLTAALLSGAARRSAWLVPEAVRTPLGQSGTDADRHAERIWRRTIDAGWLAATAAATVAIAEAADAAGGLRLSGLSDFLLSNIAGLGRVTAVVALVAAALAAPRWPRLAALWSLAALLALALSGHANSAQPRALAVLSDWAHLVAGSIWVGGIAQIVAAWWPLLREAEQPLRLAVMRTVLARFGKVALPAFLVVAAAGLVNALIQLGSVRALWQEPYGLVLGAKIELVGLIALASWWHALRIRPRLLAANPHPPAPLERRHWRLLRSEPVLGAAVLAAAAVLVAFPLPPRQLKEGDEAEAALAAQPPCNPCPLRSPHADELAVAEHAGSRIVAVWLRRQGAGTAGQMRLLDFQAKPTAAQARVAGAASQRPCGPGCWHFKLRGRPATLAVSVSERGTLYTARVPARWDPRHNRRARVLLERAQRQMASLRSLREEERITSGPGSFARNLYRLEAPDRFAYVTKSGAASVVIGRRQWIRPEPRDAWRRDLYGGGGPPFRTKSWFRWSPYAQAARLLGVHRLGGRRIAEVALMDPGSTPIWFRIPIDLGTLTVARDRMIAPGHYMSRRYYAFNQPVRIEAPRRSVGR